MSRGEVAVGWRTALADALADAGIPTAEELGGEPGRERVSHHHAAAVCAAGAFVSADEFVPTATAVARAIALTSLRATADPARRDPATPAGRVRSVVADTTTLPGWVADWLDGLDRAGVAVVVSAATRWMTDALALASRKGEPQWLDPDPIRHRVARRGVTLTAGVDAVRRTPAVHLLVVRLRPGVTDHRLAGRLALLWALERGEEPASVVLAHRESLEVVRFPMTGGVVEQAVLDAVDDVSWAMRPSEAPVVAGAACGFCSLLEVCPEGMEHRRSTSGAPFPTTIAGVDGRQDAAGGEPTM